MKLDILQITSGLSRWGDRDIKPILKLKVIPDYMQTIAVGEHHVFARGRLSRVGKKRIDAHIIFTSSEDHFAMAQEVDSELLRSQTMAGYARASFADQADDSAALVFFLFADDESIAELARKLENVDPSDVSADVGILGLRFGLPDEDIWEKPGDASFSMLPITDYSFNIAQLSTTRTEIMEVKDRRMWEEAQDADDLEDRKRAALAMKERAEREPHPLLAPLNGTRNALWLLIVIVVILGFRFASS